MGSRIRSLVAATLMLFPLLAVAGKLEVSVRQAAKVGQPVVKLGMIAEVKGQRPERVEKARGVAVHRFEADETRWQVSGRAVSQALWKAGIPLEQIRLDLPLGAVVERGTVSLGSGKVAAAVREQLARDAPPGVRLRVDFPEGAPSFGELPARGRIKVAPEKGGKARIRVTVGGEVAASRSVPIRIRRERKVVVAAENLRPGDRIKADQVKIAYRKAGGSRWAFFRGKKEAVGNWVLQPIAEGRPVRRSRLRLAPDVRPGDPVTLVYKKGKLRISTAGTVRQQAAIGEVVAMENRDSGKEVYARLTGPNIAQVVDRKGGGGEGK